MYTYIYAICRYSYTTLYRNNSVIKLNGLMDLGLEGLMNL